MKFPKKTQMKIGKIREMIKIDDHKKKIDEKPPYKFL